MPFANVYPLYIEKVERKGRSQDELNLVINWLTGYDTKQLQQQIDRDVDIENFFDQAPAINPSADKITGMICGVRVEDITDKTMRHIRQLDKLVDELSRGKSIDKILRS